MAKNAFANKLAKLKNNWKKAAAKVEQGGSEFESLEPGRYTGKIVDGEVNESQNGRLQLYIELKVTEGESQDQTIRKYYGLDNEQALTFLHRDLVRLGVEVPEDPEELETVLAQLVKSKPTLKFRVKEKGEYLNIYLDKLLGADEGGEDAEEEGEEEEETPPAKPPKKAAKEEEEEAEEEVEAGAGTDEDEEEVDIKPGLRVEVENKGEGKITEVDEEEGQITVKLDSGKTVTVGVEALTLAPEKKPAKPSLRVKRK